jgi:hypothetical protein
MQVYVMIVMHHRITTYLATTALRNNEPVTLILRRTASNVVEMTYWDSIDHHHSVVAHLDLLPTYPPAVLEAEAGTPLPSPLRPAADVHISDAAKRKEAAACHIPSVCRIPSHPAAVGNAGVVHIAGVVHTEAGLKGENWEGSEA